MGARRTRAEGLRRALYRPDAGADDVARYRARVVRPQRVLRAAAAGAAVVVVAVGLGTVGVRAVLSLPVPSRPAPMPAEPTVRGRLVGPDRVVGTAALRSLAEVAGAGEDRVRLVLDRFGEEVEGDSRIVVDVRCASGPFSLSLSTLTQGRSQVLVAPLAEASGTCGGVQRLRYRPLLGLIPTALAVEASGRVEVHAVITG